MKKLLSFLALMMLLASGCTNGGVSSNDQVIKIGYIGPLSGDAAFYGEEVQHVIEYELPRLNEKYADSGYQFEMVYEDGMCDGGAAVTALQKLTDVDGVDFILGGLCSSESLAIAPLLESKQVLALSALSSNPELEGISPYFFSTSYSDDQIGKGVANQLGQFESVALLSEQHDYPKGLLDVVTTELEANYPETTIVANEEFPNGGNDFRNLLQKLANSEAEAVFFNTAPGLTAETLVRQFAEFESWNPSVIGTLVLANEATLSLEDSPIEGAVIVDTPTVSNSNFLTHMQDIVEEQGSVENIGNYYTASTLDALHLLVDLTVKHKGDVDAVQADLSTNRFEGNIGRLYFGGQTFLQGIEAKTFVIENGEMVPME